MEWERWKGCCFSSFVDYLVSSMCEPGRWVSKPDAVSAFKDLQSGEGDRRSADSK